MVSRINQCVKAPETDVPKILFASFATANDGGIPKNISTGVIKNPPPIPNKPEINPTQKLKKITTEISILT